MRTPRERRRPRRAEERRRARTVGASPSGRRRGRRCARVHRPWSTTGTAERLRWSLSSRARLVAEPRTLFGPDTQFRPAGRLGSGQLGSWQAGLKLNCSTQINSTHILINSTRCNKIICATKSNVPWRPPLSLGFRTTGSRTWAHRRLPAGGVISPPALFLFTPGRTPPRRRPFRVCVCGPPRPCDRTRGGCDTLGTPTR